MEYKLIASDLDGTLFGPDSRVSRENWKAIEILKEKGVEFVPASGRAFYEMPAELRDSDLIRYYITSDGALVYDKQTGSQWELAMPKPASKQLLDIIYRYSDCLMVHADLNSYMDADNHNIPYYTGYNMTQSWIDSVCQVDVLRTGFREFVYGLSSIQSLCAFFRSKPEQRACIAELEATGEFLVAQSDGYNLEAFHKTAGKGNALQMLAQKLEIPVEATIAMGDSTNDLTMIQAAGLGLVMENGMQELKAVADRVICNNREHGVAWVLKEYF